MPNFGKHTVVMGQNNNPVHHVPDCLIIALCIPAVAFETYLINVTLPCWWNTWPMLVVASIS
jgi:hypothetical protein